MECSLGLEATDGYTDSHKMTLITKVTAPEGEKAQVLIFEKNTCMGFR